MSVNRAAHPIFIFVKLQARGNFRKKTERVLFTNYKSYNVTGTDYNTDHRVIGEKVGDWLRSQNEPVVTRRQPCERGEESDAHHGKQQQHFLHLLLLFILEGFLRCPARSGGRGGSSRSDNCQDFQP